MRHRTLALGMLAILTLLYSSGCSPATSAPQPTSTPEASSAAAAEITAEGRLEPVRFADLSPATDGSISELMASEGDEVQAGQVIARLQSTQAETLEAAQSSAATRLAAAYDAVRTAQSDLDDYEIPAEFSGMTAAEAAKVTLAKLQAAREAFAPYEDMSRKITKPTKIWHFPVAPRLVIDTEQYTGLALEFKKQVDSSWVKYRKAVLWLDLQSTLESAQAQLAQAQKDFDSLQDASLAEDTAGARAALANAELRSPFAGTITNLDLKLGEFAASGTPVVTVADFSSWVVKTTDLTEIDVVNIKEGQPVTLTLDAIPDVTLKGYVLSIGQNYSEKQGDVVYEVTVLLSDKHPAMRWGMTAQVHF